MQLRLDSFLSKQGVSSRRKAKELIKSNLVSVNNRVTTEIIKIDPLVDKVFLGGKLVNPESQQKRYIAFYKPLNVLSTTFDDRGRKTVLDYVKVPERVYPVGRLDYNSSGLLLLTNDGNFSLKLTHPRYHLPKKYIVKVDKKVDGEDLKKLSQNMIIDGKKVSQAQVKNLGNNKLEIVLYQGIKRQIREMCRLVDLRVVELKRVQIGNLRLGNLRPGEYRELSHQEVAELLDGGEGGSRTHIAGFSDRCRDHLGYRPVIKSAR